MIGIRPMLQLKTFFRMNSTMRLGPSLKGGLKQGGYLTW